MSDQSDRPPDDGGGGGAGGRQPFKPVHAHDEFELDIDVETDMTQVASERPGSKSLFDDDEDEPTQELSRAVLEEVLGPGQDDFDPGLPSASDEEVLPVYMSARANTPRPIALQPSPEVAIPDLSAGFDAPEPVLEPAVGRQGPDVEDLFSDVSDVSDQVPIHELQMPASTPAPSAPLTLPPEVPGLDLPAPTSTGGGGRKRRFSTGVTGGMQPLDVAQFEGELSEPRSKGKRTGRTRISQGKAAPMAGSQRVLRRDFHFGLKELLLLVLIILIGIGIWVGWSIYKDFSKRADWEKFDQSRSQLEQTRSDQIEATHPKKERDEP